MSPDVDAAKEFYSAVFGWAADDQFDDEGNRVYVMFSLDGRSVAGLGGQMGPMEGMPAVWNNYICCHDLEATVERATAAGGSVMMPPMQVMESGRMAIIADPTGAAISLWTPGAHIGAEVCNEPNTWSWTELMTRDIDTAREFYAATFEWELIGQDMGPMGTYWVVRGGDHGGWAGLMAMPPDVPDEVPNHWMAYFATDDIDATLAAIGANGGQTVVEPFDIPGVGRVATVHDPQGGSFSVMQPVAES
jgi:predicted enzyme related to lactoylglutathione lyase